MLQHRNSQKRIYLKDVCYFVTTVTHERHPYFKERFFCDLFLKQLVLCKKTKRFKWYGWFLGYDHCHLLFQPNDTWDYSQIMHFLKRNFSRDVNKMICPTPPEGADPYPRQSHRDVSGEGDVVERRLRVDEINHTDVLREHHKYIQRLKLEFILKYPYPYAFPKFQWQKSFHDHIIRTHTDNDFDQHLKYIAGNPQKHHMPEGWPYVFTNADYAYLIDPFL